MIRCAAALTRCWLNRDTRRQGTRHPGEAPVPVSLQPFTDEHCWWLEKMAEHIASNLGLEADDFELPRFNQRGGLGEVHQLFCAELPKVIEAMNTALVA